MKNVRRNLLILCCLGLAALFMASCSSFKPLAVNTRLAVDGQFDGQRVMSVVLTSKEFKSLFDNDLEKLKTFLKDSCPDNMYSDVVQKDDKSVEITLTVPFASYTDYYDKVMKIFSGRDRSDDIDTPSVYYEASNSLLKKGFVIEENFTSMDLCFWLTEAMIEQISGLSGKSPQDIFVAGTTVLEYDGEVIKTEPMIKVSQIEANALDSITVETTLNQSGSIDASVDFYAGAEVVEKLGTQLTSTMNKSVPKGGTMTSKTADGGKVFNIRFSAVSAEDYAVKMNKLLHTDNTIFKIVEESDELDTLKARKKITQYLDGSYFLDFTNEASVMTYVLKAPADYTFENCESTYQHILTSNYENTEDFCSTYVTVRPSDEITVYLGYSVAIDKIEVNTIMHSPVNFERDLKFTLTGEQNRIIGEQFEERILERLNEQVTFVKDQTPGSVIYHVTVKADSPQNLSLYTNTFLDGYDDTENTRLSGGLSEHERLRKVRYEYTDKINLMTFLSGSQSTKGLYYRFEYPKGYKAHFSNNNNCENVLEDYNVLTCITYNKVIEVTSYAEKTNVVGILQWVFWLLALAGMLIVIVLNLGNILRCVKSRKFDAGVLGLFSHKGYIYVTIFALCAVVFVISTLRLVFGIY